MNRLRIIPLDDSVVFPGMPVTLPVDVGSDDRVLLVPRQNTTYSKVGIVAEVSDRMRLAGRGVAKAAPTGRAVVGGPPDRGRGVRLDLSGGKRVDREGVHDPCNGVAPDCVSYGPAP